MWSQSKKFLIGLLTSTALIPSLIHAQNASPGSAGCSAFYQERGFYQESGYTKLSNQSYRVSKGITCTPNHSGYTVQNGCPLDAYGYLDLPRTSAFVSNDSTSVGANTTSANTDATFATILEAITNRTQDLSRYPSLALLKQSSVQGVIANSTLWAPVNTSAYVVYTPYYACVYGQLDGCVEDYYPNGTFVEACVADTDSSRLDNTGDTKLLSLSGLTGVVLTDRQTVENMTANPHGQRPKEDAEVSTGMAGSGLGFSSSIIGLALLAVGMSTFA